MNKAIGNSLADKLRLHPDYEARMRRIFAESAEIVQELRPDWYRIRLQDQHLRLFFGRLIVMTLEGSHIWLTTDPSFQPVSFSALASWRSDEIGVRPIDAKSEPYPMYKIPPSLNGFYTPAADPRGAEWLALRTSHVSYLKRVAIVGRTPDRRTVHDLVAASEIHSWGALESTESLFEVEIQKAIVSDSTSRLLRLKDAPSKPLTRTHEVRIFERNPDVVAEVLFRANGICELCGRTAPFRRAAGGTPYLEVHHRTRLADGGDDTVQNAIALCPNCHRQQHYG